ncbi:metal ABC transporter solute-binding protein, Zn/Mn family [Salinicola rhizosphaerae]|uniref:ABC transporter substrate-binding protein n=1 Tax=Salinicola rhizosphaerae TaxID=1443141 RepID=A0ABQ3DSY3_9GAMM|nr:zinc ABC transporter substrate-binding protein [Salinicola rhizosphaerae]GHB13855.1 ABC transporter substrate-binding protein [Salinicola rhizosphaerae]
MSLSRRLLSSLVALSVISVAGIGSAQAAIHAVAAESSYGSMVESIGGDHVDVVSLLDSPDVNPHAFRADPKIVRNLEQADLVVLNGLGFDGWMEPLLKSTDGAERQVIRASEAGSHMIMADKNPHLFYSPQIMLATASRVASALETIDPDNADDYRDNLAAFQQSLLPVYGAVQQVIADHPNLSITATVPVYSYMIALLGYENRYHDIQFASMDNHQPSAQQVAIFTDALKQHQVDLLIYNLQVNNRLTQNQVSTAKEAGIPTVGVSAIPLHGEDYAQWQIEQLDAIDQALNQADQDANPENHG